jgi:hypothetical protein
MDSAPEAEAADSGLIWPRSVRCVRAGRPAAGRLSEFCLHHFVFGRPLNFFIHRSCCSVCSCCRWRVVCAVRGLQPLDRLPAGQSRAACCLLSSSHACSCATAVAAVCRCLSAFSSASSDGISTASVSSGGNGISPSSVAASDPGAVGASTALCARRSCAALNSLTWCASCSIMYNCSPGCWLHPRLPRSSSICLNEAVIRGAPVAMLVSSTVMSSSVWFSSITRRACWPGDKPTLDRST